jgi:DNA-binding transcriptional LysR family regulator
VTRVSADDGDAETLLVQLLCHMEAEAPGAARDDRFPSHSRPLRFSSTLPSHGVVLRASNAHRKWAHAIPASPLGWHAGSVESEIELRHFRYVLAVAEEGTFTGAAARLGMTQPALSRAIRALETAVGSALFQRGHHGASLTEAGRAFRDDALAVDRMARAAVSRTSRHSNVGQHLRVTARGCDIGALEVLVASYNAARGDRAPAQGAVVDGRVQADEIRAGEADVTLARTPLDISGLDSELVRSDPRVALLPKAHPLATLQIIDRSELDGETFPVWSGHTPEQTAHWTGTDLARQAWKPGPTVSDAAQYAACIRLGDAVGIVPEPLLPEIVLTGISVVQVAGISASELRIAWSESATSRDIADFVRHATNSARRWSAPASVNDNPLISTGAGSETARTWSPGS